MTDGASLILPTPGLSPDMSFYMTGEDAIQITVINGAAGVTVSLTGRFLPAKILPDDPDPRVQSFRHDLVPATNRTASLKTANFGDGWMLDGQVRVTAGAPLIGQCFVIVSLVRGTAGALQDETLLAQGYVTASQRIPIWGLRFTTSLDGPAAIRSITGTTPAAGAEINEVVPAGARWQMLAWALTFATSATVANRAPVFTFDDGALVYGRTAWNALVAASTTIRFNGLQGFSTPWNDQAGNGYVPLPPAVWMLAGHHWRSATTNLQVTDQYSGIQYLVAEMIEGN